MLNSTRPIFKGMILYVSGHVINVLNRVFLDKIDDFICIFVVLPDN